MAMTFADLGVSGPVRAALDSRGITTPFPVQELVLPVALTGRDAVSYTHLTLPTTPYV